MWRRRDRGWKGADRVEGPSGKSGGMRSKDKEGKGGRKRREREQQVGKMNEWEILDRKR